MSSSTISLQQSIIFNRHNDPIHQLYNEHYGWLYVYLCKKLQCPEQAADLSQDTFVKLLKKKKPLELHTPKAYLSTIAHGLVVNHWRRKEIERNYIEALTVLPIAEVPSAERHAIIIETLSRIDQALKDLPPLVREAFLLSQLQGLTYKVIAQQLQLSERTIKNYMAQAMLHCLLIAESDD